MKRAKRGIDSVARLRAFFQAKGHKNLVLRVVDILDMPQASQAALRIWLAAATVLTIDYSEQSLRQLKQWFVAIYPTGYIVVPWKAIGDDLKELELLQQLLAEYRSVRLGKGEPSEKKPCPTCGGSGGKTHVSHGAGGPMLHGNKGQCPDCEGLGWYRVFVEMSEEERKLAEGGA